MNLRPWLSLAAALTAAHAAAAPVSLCNAGETPIFSCPLQNKIVSVCAPAGGGAVYRFGRPGAIELQSGDLALAQHGFSGGGETQISFKTRGYQYVIYARTVRTSVGSDGRHDAQSVSGLAILKGGRKISDRACGGDGDQPVDTDAAGTLKPGGYVPLAGAS